MSNDLLKQLEAKINEAIETIEFSRMEITDLKEKNSLTKKTCLIIFEELLNSARTILSKPASIYVSADLSLPNCMVPSFHQSTISLKN